MNDQQKQNRQQIIAAEAIDRTVLLREATYLRGRIERLEAQVVTLETRLAATAEDAEGEHKPGDSHDYLEPMPSNFGTILEYFDARVEYHDRDESEGDSDVR